MRAVATAVVPAPPERVWEVLVDHEGMSSWGPGMTVTLDKVGAAERNGLGAVRRIKAPGPMPAIVEEVTGFDAPRRFAYRALSGVPFRNYHGEVLLTPSGTGTAIEYAVSVDPRVSGLEGAAARLVATTLLRLLVKATRR